MSQVSETSSFDAAYGGGNPLTAGNNGDLDKDAFLTLLVTQFQYQDPLNPMDDKEFIAQLAQFSALEQTMLTNENLEKVVISTNQQTVISVTDYIGRDISALGDNISSKDGAVSLVQFAASVEMASAYVNILDLSGQVIDTVDLGAKAPGIHDFTWDGKRSNGSDAPDGVYRVAFSGKDMDGALVQVDTSVSGRVTGTTVYQGQHILLMEDGRQVYLVGVREVLEAQEKEDDKEEILGKEIKGTSAEDYLVGGAGADTITALGGNDIIVYDPLDVLVDGGDGYDFLIAEGAVGKNAVNYEAIIRGADAQVIKKVQNLKDMGLEFTADGSEIDITSPQWKANWTDSGGGQWTYSKDDKKMTIEIMSQVDKEPEIPPKPETDTETPPETVRMARSSVSEAAKERTVNFSQALKDGMNKSIDGTAQSLSNNASSVINRYMKAMNG